MRGFKPTTVQLELTPAAYLAIRGKALAAGKDVETWCREELTKAADEVLEHRKVRVLPCMDNMMTRHAQETNRD